jgi:type I restriction enzyme S subunit
VELPSLRSYPLPLPPLSEQQAIAEALSDVDGLIDGLEKLFAKKRDIMTATMHQLLTGKRRLPGFGEGTGYKQAELGEIPVDWDVVALGALAAIEMGQSPRSEFYNNSGVGLPLIQGNADVNERKTIIRNYTSMITKKALKSSIIVSVRAPVGEVAIAMFDCCLGRGVCGITYQNEYLYHWLIGHEAQWEKYSKGSTFDSINGEELRAIPILVPQAEDEQQAIAKALSDMDKEIAAIQSRLDKTKAIKQGMMQELLMGKARLI